MNIFIAGDSTAAPKLANKRPETGWGERLGCYVAEGVGVSNHAHNGESTKTFFATGRADALFEQVGAGDVVLIQFGHNDEHDKPHQHTEANGDFKTNLTRLVGLTREHGALPVLMTPIARRAFGEDGSPRDTHGAYAEATRVLAAELGVALVDMARATEALLAELGEQGSQVLFDHLEPGEHPNYPEGVDDHTHLCPHGAYVVAGLAARGLAALGLPELDGALVADDPAPEPEPERGDGAFPVDQRRFEFRRADERAAEEACFF